MSDDPTPESDENETDEQDPEWDDRARPPARRRRGEDAQRRRQLPPDDPYWQFGMPVESWGSSVRRGEGPRPARGQGPRGYFECRACGVKVESKPRQRGPSRCPMCGRNMRLVTP